MNLQIELPTILTTSVINLFNQLIKNKGINIKKLYSLDNNVLESDTIDIKNIYCKHRTNKNKLCLNKCIQDSKYCKIHDPIMKEQKRINRINMNEKRKLLNKEINIFKNIEYESTCIPFVSTINNTIEVNIPPSYEQKPDETGKSIINEINNSNDISKPMFNNNIIKICKKRKSKNNNKIIKIDYNKIFNEVKLYKKNNSLNLNDNKYKIILCNKELEEQYIEIAKFTTKYDFLTPLILDYKSNNPSVIDVMDKTTYINHLHNLKLTDYPNFRGKDIQEMARTIVSFQFKAYSYSIFNKPILTNNVINNINQFISRIPK